jgi:gluconokinase
MDVRIHPTVVVMGVTGSGKTTVGLLLAHQLGVPFADADDFHTLEMKAKMAAGHPLDDADRAPWLRRLAEWLAGQSGGCVLACSALKRAYRDVLRSGAPRLAFLHLAGEPVVASERVAHRTQHYMPASLVGSQYATLQPLQPDEFGVAIDFTLGPERIVERFLHEIQAAAEHPPTAETQTLRTEGGPRAAPAAGTAETPADKPEQTSAGR